jgi:hypothetical protein
MTRDFLLSKWNEILDDLLAHNRIAWLAFFDARISSVLGNTITLSFIDVEKLGNPHNYEDNRNVGLRTELEQAIYRILGINCEIIIG